MQSSNSSQFSRYFHEIDIEINHACNRTCWYCPNDSTARSEKGEMSEELFSRIIAQLKEINYKGKICFHFYNEPLLCTKLDSFTALSKKLLPDCKIELVTNGTLLSLERFLKLSELGVDIFTITKHHGIDQLPVELFSNDIEKDLQNKINLKNHSQLYYSNRAGLVPSLSEGKLLPLKRPCFIPSCMLVVTVKGNILACYEDYEQKSEMGNINTSTLKEIWNSENYANFREDLKKGHRTIYKLCQSCDNTKMIQ